MKWSEYNLGFTAASLRPELMREEAEVFLRTRDWEATKQEILDKNPFQCGSATTLSRFEREIRGRLQKLTSSQLELLVAGAQETRQALSWLAVVKKYTFLLHAVTQMVALKLDRYETVLQPSDYDAFFQEEADLYPEVARLSESSKGKVKRVLLRMLREVGYLQKGPGLGQLARPFLPPDVRQVIQEDDSTWLVAFLEEHVEREKERQAYG